MTSWSLASAFGVDIQARELADPSSTFLIAQVEGTAAGYFRDALRARA